MKKTAIFLGIAALLSASFSSCSSKGASGETETDNTLTVDSILAQPDSFVGKTITVEGVVSHLCKHGGRKAFLLGSDENTMLRADATPGGDFTSFAPDCIHKPITLTGTLVESRIDEAAVREMEAQRAGQIQRVTEAAGEADAANAEAAAQQAEALKNAPAGCETEHKAAGQSELATFATQMADYRARIAARDSIEGKSYLSTYYIQAISYSVLPE